MDVGQILPILLGGGAITAIIAALRWGRQDARDAVEVSSQNQADAMLLKADAMTEVARLRVELAASLAEAYRLRVLLTAHGIDPASAS